MKTTKMLKILVLALGLMAWQVEVSEAVPMGTAFTYQGRLLDANDTADGEYDFQFKLFDAPNGGVQQGGTNDINDVDVIDGYFTAEVDFGNKVFKGDARWFEIGLRSGDSTERHTILSPRQQVTPTPYALFAENSGTDNDWMVTGNNMYATPSGNVGIGTSEPEEKLHVEGNVQIDGSLSCQYGVTGWSDLTTGNNTGVVGWTWTPTMGTNFAIMGHASNTLGPAYAGYFTGDVYASGKVGIGTASPVSKLDVAEGCITGSLCSDIRLKKNIEPLPSDDSILDRVMGLQAVTFEWKHRDDSHTQIGLIAQDVEEVFPEVVTTPDDGTCEKGLLATGMDAVLVEAIKELKFENESLKDRIESLERIIEEHQFSVAKKVEE